MQQRIQFFNVKATITSWKAPCHILVSLSTNNLVDTEKNNAQTQNMNPQKYAAIQKEVQEIYQILQKTETELNGNIQARNKYQGQLNENKLVNSELSLLNDDQDQKKVYKLIGPALVQQDLSEAKQTVTKRVKFLEKEMCVLTKCFNTIIIVRD